MRRAPCPRCARPTGVPIEYGLPDEELVERASRGEILIGGCVVVDRAPDFRCSSCGREWVDGPLPPWWPPVDVETMDDSARFAAHADLTERFDAVRHVLDVVRRDGVDAGGTAVIEMRFEFAMALIGDLAEGMVPTVVPSDCVLLAEALAAGVALCAGLETDENGEPHPADLVEDRMRAFERAEAELRAHGYVDVLRVEVDIDDEDDEDDDDPDDNPWLTDEDRFEALAGDGDGATTPALGPEWHEELDALASDLLDEGSATAWARFVWSHLAFDPIATELDLARARIRLVALAILRRGFLDRLDGDVADEFPWSSADDPGIGSFLLGRLAETDHVAPERELDYWDEDPVETEAFRELVRVECDRLGSALANEVGVSRLFAHTWASRFAGARYPLSADAKDEALNANLTPDKHIAFEWLGERMPL